MNDNNIYLSEKNITVTSKELIINSSRFYIKDINSVIVVKAENHRGYFIFMAILLFLFTKTHWIFSLLAIASVLYAIIGMRSNYILTLKMSFGEACPLTSRNKYELEYFKDAINKAITERNDRDLLNLFKDI